MEYTDYSEQVDTQRGTACLPSSCSWAEVRASGETLAALKSIGVLPPSAVGAGYFLLVCSFVPRLRACLQSQQGIRYESWAFPGTVFSGGVGLAVSVPDQGANRIGSAVSDANPHCVGTALCVSMDDLLLAVC